MLSEAVIVWIVTAIIFGITEACTIALVSVWLAIGALAAATAAYFGADITIQLLVFSFSALVLLIATRPFAKKVLKNKVEPTNADRIVGQTAQVTEKIDNIENRGQVKVIGEIWTARSADNSVIPEGSAVKIEKIEGVKVIVSLVN